MENIYIVDFIVDTYDDDSDPRYERIHYYRCYDNALEKFNYYKNYIQENHISDAIRRGDTAKVSENENSFEVDFPEEDKYDYHCEVTIKPLETED